MLLSKIHRARSRLSGRVNRIRAHPPVTTIIADDIFSRSIAHSRARFRPTLRWNPRRSPAIELDRQGRSCRREDERIRGSARFTRCPVWDRPTLAGPEDTSPTSTPTFPPQGEEETVREREIGSGNEWKERERG